MALRPLRPGELELAGPGAGGQTAERCSAAVDGVARVLDLHPAQEWLRHRALFLDTTSGMDLWNWAVDVDASTGQAWNPRGTLVDRCYDELFAANVPYFFDLESYRAQWTPRQLRVLRRVLGSACHVIRSASA